MDFIELSGQTLLQVLTDEELTAADLAQIGLSDHSIVRVNRQGDIELRRRKGWDVIGGLLGNFEERLKHRTGLDWASPGPSPEAQ
jgi:hypothetical protein